MWLCKTGIDCWRKMRRGGLCYNSFGHDDVIQWLNSGNCVGILFLTVKLCYFCCLFKLLPYLYYMVMCCRFREQGGIVECRTVGKLEEVRFSTYRQHSHIFCIYVIYWLNLFLTDTVSYLLQLFLFSFFPLASCFVYSIIIYLHHLTCCYVGWSLQRSCASLYCFVVFVLLLCVCVCFPLSTLFITFVLGSSAFHSLPRTGFSAWIK